MRHRMSGYKLSRSTNERKRLFRSLCCDLIKNGSIKTTYTKAKAVQPTIEKLITKAKKGGDKTRRDLLSILDSKENVRLLIEFSKSRFDKRVSGYTSIIKLGPRLGDGCEEAMIRFVDEIVKEEKVSSKKNKKDEKEKKEKMGKKTKQEEKKAKIVEKDKKKTSKKSK